MRAIAIDVLLALAVLACWLGAAGFLRVRTARDRLHSVTFANGVAGVAVVAAAFVADGASDSALKVLIVAAAALLIGGTANLAIAGVTHERRRSGPAPCIGHPRRPFCGAP